MTQQRTEPHTYEAEKSGWRTCRICGRGANAGIHKPRRTTEEVIADLTREAVHGPHGARECPDPSICPTHDVDPVDCFTVFGTFTPPRYEP